MSINTKASFTELPQTISATNLEDLNLETLRKQLQRLKEQKSQQLIQLQEHHHVLQNVTEDCYQRYKKDAQEFVNLLENNHDMEMQALINKICNDIALQENQNSVTTENTTSIPPHKKLFYLSTENIECILSRYIHEKTPPTKITKPEQLTSTESAFLKALINQRLCCKKSLTEYTKYQKLLAQKTQEVFMTKAEIAQLGKQ